MRRNRSQNGADSGAEKPEKVPKMVPDGSPQYASIFINMHQLARQAGFCLNVKKRKKPQENRGFLN
jgi:hypothetical protein